MFGGVLVLEVFLEFGVVLLEFVVFDEVVVFCGVWGVYGGVVIV